MAFVLACAGISVAPAESERATGPDDLPPREQPVGDESFLPGDGLCMPTSPLWSSRESSGREPAVRRVAAEAGPGYRSRLIPGVQTQVAMIAVAGRARTANSQV